MFVIILYIFDFTKVCWGAYAISVVEISVVLCNTDLRNKQIDLGYL